MFGWHWVVECLPLTLFLPDISNPGNHYWLGGNQQHGMSIQHLSPDITIDSEVLTNHQPSLTSNTTLQNSPLKHKTRQVDACSGCFSASHFSHQQPDRCCWGFIRFYESQTHHWRCSQPETGLVDGWPALGRLLSPWHFLLPSPAVCTNCITWHGNSHAGFNSDTSLWLQLTWGWPAMGRLLSPWHFPSPHLLFVPTV